MARQRVLEARVAELTAECEQLRVSYERALAYELAQAATVTLAMAKAAGAGGCGALTQLEDQVGGSAGRRGLRGGEGKMAPGGEDQEVGWDRGQGK